MAAATAPNPAIHHHGDSSSKYPLANKYIHLQCNMCSDCVADVSYTVRPNRNACICSTKQSWLS